MARRLPSYAAGERDNENQNELQVGRNIREPQRNNGSRQRQEPENQDSAAGWHDAEHTNPSPIRQEIAANHNETLLINRNLKVKTALRAGKKAN